MQILSKKTIAITITALFVASMAIATIPFQLASAHSPPWNIPTFAYITATPDPVGVGQRVSVLIWLDKILGYGATDPSAYANLGNSIRFQNYNLTIIGPNGTNSVIFPTVFDTTSSQFYGFTPTQAGNYTLRFDFPGQTYTWNDTAAQRVYTGDYYLPSNASETLIVQNEPIPGPIGTYPLPNEYWTRPIYGENPGWWTISSNWLGNGQPSGSGVYGAAGWSASSAATIRYPGDAVGPLTSHIMWTKPLQAGGIVGGDYQAILGDTFFEGSAYNNRYTNPIVMNGKIYYTEPVAFSGPNSGPTDCVDLRTGQLIWSRSDIPALSFGYIYDNQDPNQHGVMPPILATTNFAQLYDADTGRALFNVTNVPSGTAVLGPQGEHLRYVFINAGTTANPNYVLAQWNSSRLWNRLINPYTGGNLLYPSIINMTSFGNTSQQFLLSTIPVPLTGASVTLSNSTGPAPNTYSATIPPNATLVVDGGVFNFANAQNRYDWNVSVPWRNNITASVFTVVSALYNDIMIVRNGALPSLTPTVSVTTPYTYMGINLNASKGTLGSVLWTQTYDSPSGNYTIYNGGADPQTRVFLELYKETRQWIGYSMNDGSKLWGPTVSQTSLDYYGQPYFPILGGQIAYGHLYSSAYGGILYCYDMSNGNLTWTYGNGGPGNSTSAGFNIAKPNYPTYIAAVGNNVIYTITTEHTPETPLYKGALARAVNATDGHEIWTLSDYTGSFNTIGYAIADGYATFFNGYDNSIYSVGRGPTQLITSSSPLGSTGGNIVVSGRLVDISAGTKDPEQQARFPNGVPCADDSIMTDWMGYVYQQKPFPTNFTGVPINIVVTDANGNQRSIGTAHTDAGGSFTLTWAPDISGNFAVTAQFAGTNAYWPSTAYTSFNVAQAASTPGGSSGGTGGNSNSTTNMYILGSAAAIIIIVIIVGAVIVLTRRR